MPYYLCCQGTYTCHIHKSAPRLDCLRAEFFYAPTHDVAPRAVTMAVATDAMICTINFIVSFFVMVN